MKKTTRISIILLVCIILFNMPISIKADEYEFEGTDITIEIGDEWHIMTRDNPLCCEEMEALGLSEEYMKNHLLKNDMYLDAVLTHIDSKELIEMCIRKITVEELKISQMSEDDVDELMEILEEAYTPDVCEVYKNDYIYVYTENVDGGYNILDFITVINSDIYIITFQKMNQYSDKNMEKIYEIVDSASYTIKPLQTDSEDGMDNDTNWKYILRNSIIGGIIGSAVGGAAGLVVSFIIRHNKKKRKNKD